MVYIGQHKIRAWAEIGQNRIWWDEESKELKKRWKSFMDVTLFLFGNCENLPPMPDKLILNSSIKNFLSHVWNCDAFESKFAELSPAELLLFVNCNKNSSRRKLHYSSNEKNNSLSNCNSLLSSKIRSNLFRIRIDF